MSERSLRALCGVAVFAAALGFARVAGAFCRTTATRAPANYDPASTSVNACWTTTDGGSVLDLAWPARSRMAYSMDSNASWQVNLAEATRVAHLAFDAWNKAMCPPGCVGNACQPPNVQAFDRGPVSPDAAADDCGLIDCGTTFHDTQHVIVFRDDGWPYNDSANTLALTTVTYGSMSGTIFDADIEINSFMFPPTVQEPPPPNRYSLQGILTHEAGHFFGLAHATDTTAIMYAHYPPGTLQFATDGTPRLTPDDLAGICAIYPPLPPQSGACAASPQSAPSFAVTSASLALLVFGSLRRRSTRARLGCAGGAFERVPELAHIRISRRDKVRTEKGVPPGKFSSAPSGGGGRDEGQAAAGVVKAGTGLAKVAAAASAAGHQPKTRR